MYGLQKHSLPASYDYNGSLELLMKFSDDEFQFQQVPLIISMMTIHREVVHDEVQP